MWDGDGFNIGVAVVDELHKEIDREFSTPSGSRITSEVHRNRIG